MLLADHILEEPKYVKIIKLMAFPFTWKRLDSPMGGGGGSAPFGELLHRMPALPGHAEDVTGEGRLNIASSLFQSSQIDLPRAVQ